LIYRTAYLIMRVRKEAIYMARHIRWRKRPNSPRIQYLLYAITPDGQRHLRDGTSAKRYRELEKTALSLLEHGDPGAFPNRFIAIEIVKRPKLGVEQPHLRVNMPADQVPEITRHNAEMARRLAEVKRSTPDEVAEAWHEHCYEVDL
jgi:hypothetical protein